MFTDRREDKLGELTVGYKEERRRKDKGCGDGAAEAKAAKIRYKQMP